MKSPETRSGSGQGTKSLICPLLSLLLSIKKKNNKGGYSIAWRGQIRIFVPSPLLSRVSGLFLLSPVCPRGDKMTLICPLLPVRAGKRGAGKPPWERVSGFCPLFSIPGTKCLTGDKTGTNCPQALCIKGFRVFLSVPCYGFSEGTKWHEALTRAGLRVFVPCFRYRGQNA